MRTDATGRAERRAAVFVRGNGSIPERGRACSPPEVSSKAMDEPRISHAYLMLIPYFIPARCSAAGVARTLMRLFTFEVTT